MLEKKYQKAMTLIQKRYFKNSVRALHGLRSFSNGDRQDSPHELLGFGKKSNLLIRRGSRKKTVFQDERTRTMTKWQERWTEAVKISWTRRLVKDVTQYNKMKFCEVTFYLTMFLFEHGYLWQYLCHMSKITTAGCKYCGNDKDNTDNTFLYTPDRQKQGYDLKQ